MLEIASGGTIAGTLLLSGSNDVLRIDDGTSLRIPGGFTVSGFVAGDTIDLTGIAFDSSGSVNPLAGNLLQIIENGATYDLQLDPLQSFAGEFFHLTSDTAGGTRIIEDTTLPTGTSVTVSAGQTRSGVNVGSGATLTVLAGGSVSDTTVSSGGDEYVSSGGTDSGAQLNGGTQFDYGSATNAVVAGGSQIVYGSALSTTISSGGTETIEFGRQ